MDLKSNGDGFSADSREQVIHEVCTYIGDMLGSIEDIANHHDLRILARLVSAAKEEARACR